MLNRLDMPAGDARELASVVRAEPVEDVFDAASRDRRLAGGCPAATHFLLRRQKKVSKEKTTRWSGSLRCSIPAGGVRTRLRLKQLPPLTPPPSALLGPARRVGETNAGSDAGSPDALRASGRTMGPPCLHEGAHATK